jgi:tetratricopeptide (TPR) repeat protein
MSNLAYCYINQGKCDEAEKMFKECLEKRTYFLEMIILILLQTLILSKIDMMSQSIKLYQECLERKEKDQF